MQEATAKLMFDAGTFSKAIVVPVPMMSSGYHLHLVKFSKNSGTEIIEKQRSGYRIFKTIDAAVNTARAIGFKRIEVDLSSL
jgi:membrane protein CcdC involved in cytochrome C biogenesis